MNVVLDIPNIFLECFWYDFTKASEAYGMDDNATDILFTLITNADIITNNRNGHLPVLSAAISLELYLLVQFIEVEISHFLKS